MQPKNKYETHLQQYRLQHLFDHGPADWTEYKIMDYGCGDGSLWNGSETFIKESGVTLEGFDIDENQISPASKTGLYNVLTSNVNEVYPPGYSAMLVYGVLEHVEQDCQFLASLAGSEMIIVTVPNANSFHRMVGMDMGMIAHLSELTPGDIEIGHKQVFSYGYFSIIIFEMARVFEYEVIEIGTHGFKAVSSAQMETWSDELIEAQRVVAEDCGLIGAGEMYGAECYAVLRKMEGQ